MIVAQTDFWALAAGLKDIALEISRLPNMPLVDENTVTLNELQDTRAENQNQAFLLSLLREMRAFRTEVHRCFAQFERHMHVAFVPYHSISDLGLFSPSHSEMPSSIARNIKFTITNPKLPLAPLKTAHNEDVNDFPASLDQLSGAHRYEFRRPFEDYQFAWLTVNQNRWPNIRLFFRNTQSRVKGGL